MHHENGTAAAPPADSMAGALEEYLAAAEAGRAPPREEFLARHPELAEDLDACLAALRLIGRAARGPLSAAGGGEVLPLAEPDGGPVFGVLGDFRIVREVGRGGMGVVYEAEQISLGRRVALKVLPFAATLDPRQLQRFHNEVRAAASLDHPHIVHVHAVGCERAVHFYAMQFIDGQTLAAMIADLRQAGGRPARPEAQPTTPHIPEPSAPASPAVETAPQAAVSTERAPLDRAYFRRVAELGIQAAEALDHAHTLGIVHRDVKPANLLVDGRGGLWVADFGLAHIQSDARLTMTGDLVGTLRYMSPEQALAKRVVIDHRTDVYSLGATLYELLTLEPAYSGADRQELLRQIAFEEPKPPRRINKAIPAELETILLKAMEKNAADRYTTAQELADDLRRFLAGEPIRARPPGVVRRLRKWGRRHRAALVALTAAVTSLSAAVGWVASDRARQAGITETEARAALDESVKQQQRRRVPDALSAARRAKGLMAADHLNGALRRSAVARVDDLELLDRLEEAHLEGTVAKDNWFDGGELTDRRYGEILQEFHLDLEGWSAEEAGKHLRDSTVSLELAAVLDDWAMLRRRLNPEDKTRWTHLLKVARAADPDGWRTQLRDALAREDRDTLVRLVSSEKIVQLSPETLVAAGKLLERMGAVQPAEDLLRAGQRQHPEDFWINEELGFLLLRWKPIPVEEAIPFLAVAVALRPLSSGAHFTLGSALYSKRDLDGAVAELSKAIELDAARAPAHYHLGITHLARQDYDAALAEFRKAVECDPRYTDAHNNFGVSLFKKNDLNGAADEFRKAIESNPGNALAHEHLGAVLYRKNDLDGAADEFRKAIEIDPRLATAHSRLGNVLSRMDDMEGATAEHQLAIELDPRNATAHNSFGVILEARGDWEGAMDEYRIAVGLGPKNARAHAGIGLLLRRKGQFAEALLYLRRSHELDSKDPGLSESRARDVRDCERLIELEGKLPGILSRKAAPANAAERAEYAGVCQLKRLYASATSLYQEALAAQPKLLESPLGDVRYNAACAAALAGYGAGEDGANSTEVERAGFRKQALDWLRADLDAWRGQLDKDPDKTRPAVAQKMRHWLHDADFTGVRGPDALDKLPEAERQAWWQLWGDVQRLLDRAAATPTPAPAKKP